MTFPAERYSVALAGFSEFERSALASFFRLAAQRSPAYEQVDDPAHADFLIADADLASALAAVQRAGRGADTVFVGASAPPGSMAWLSRPIDPMHIVRELDVLVSQRRALPSLYADPVEPADEAGVDLLLDIHASFQAAATAPEQVALAPGRGGQGREVLVVEDSAIARRFLEQRLQRLGYRVQLATSGEEALERLAQHRFTIVFVDLKLGPPGRIDGLQLCQTIKHRAAGDAGPAEAKVVIVTGQTSASDRVRGSLAGCDAYLVKPLMETEFMAALREVDPSFKSG